jgi:CheY-like chemotaxis protein
VKILVVDDETAILETLEILFRGEGWDVALADSGPKALAALEDEKPDIVLTDIRMPGAGGLDVLSEAHAVDPEMPVILMTAQASLQTAVRAVNEGAYYYLQKPFANEELLAICRRAAEARELKAENRRLKKEIKKRSRSGAGPPDRRRAPLRRGAGVGRDGRSHRLHRPDLRGERHGKGGPGALHPRAVRAVGRCVPLHQLRRAARELARE